MAARCPSRITSLTALALVIGCTDGGVGPLDGPDLPETSDLLDFRLPALGSALGAAPARLDAGSAEGPALTDRDESLDSVPDEESSIIDAKTVPGFEPGYAWVRGEHWYSGNKGRVETTAHVSLGGEPLGSQSSATEGYGLFLLDGGRTKFISTTARVYTDVDCGLSVGGESEHSAWWEFFTGMAVSTWGKTTRSTSAAPVSQGACAPPPPPPTTTTGSEAYYCYYYVTYDVETGEVYDSELLYCDIDQEGYF